MHVCFENNDIPPVRWHQSDEFKLCEVGVIAAWFRTEAHIQDPSTYSVRRGKPAESTCCSWPTATSSRTCSLQAPPALSLGDADRQPPSTRLWMAPTEPSSAACLPAFASHQPAKETSARKHTQPPSTRGQASSSVCSSCSICPTLSAVFEQPTRSPFICSAVAISPELPIISSSSTKNRGSLETRLSLAEISLSQWVVNAPIMLAFLILCYYYPRLPFSLQRIKRQGFQGRTMALCICQRLDKQYLCVSALLETSLLWESGCVRPPVRQCRGVSVCPPTQLPSQQHVHPQLPGNQHRSASAQRQR